MFRATGWGQKKMEEYIANGLRLGWLIDPDNKTVYIYRPGTSPETLKSPATLSGDPVLRGFVFNIAEIW
jgi:Uma2 family endonuclease